ncbi:MAG: hypothetical protein P0S94_03630 [Simkaniaceae bacterium]|nr:hypothetical protein [Simkaniaceae bacterium]
MSIPATTRSAPVLTVSLDPLPWQSPITTSPICSQDSGYGMMDCDPDEFDVTSYPWYLVRNGDGNYDFPLAASLIDSFSQDFSTIQGLAPPHQYVILTKEQLQKTLRPNEDILLVIPEMLASIACVYDFSSRSDAAALVHKKLISRRVMILAHQLLPDGFRESTLKIYGLSFEKLPVLRPYFVNNLQEQQCHPLRKDEKEYEKPQLTVVSGQVCAGKSTFVRSYSALSSPILSLDADQVKKLLIESNKDIHISRDAGGSHEASLACKQIVEDYAFYMRMHLIIQTMGNIAYLQELSIRAVTQRYYFRHFHILVDGATACERARKRNCHGEQIRGKPLRTITQDADQDLVTPPLFRYHTIRSGEYSGKYQPHLTLEHCKVDIEDVGSFAHFERIYFSRSRSALPVVNPINFQFVEENAHNSI